MVISGISLFNIYIIIWPIFSALTALFISM